jgi:hypothetical protein
MKKQTGEMKMRTCIKKSVTFFLLIPFPFFFVRANVKRTSSIFSIKPNDEKKEERKRKM